MFINVTECDSPVHLVCCTNNQTLKLINQITSDFNSLLLQLQEEQKHFANVLDLAANYFL